MWIASRLRGVGIVAPSRSEIVIVLELVLGLGIFLAAGLLGVSVSARVDIGEQQPKRPSVFALKAFPNSISIGLAEQDSM